jgi:hypothetical protein
MRDTGKKDHTQIRLLIGYHLTLLPPQPRLGSWLNIEEGLPQLGGFRLKLSFQLPHSCAEPVVGSLERADAIFVVNARAGLQAGHAEHRRLHHYICPCHLLPRAEAVVKLAEMGLEGTRKPKSKKLEPKK